ncbi:MAG: hypothetical protein JXQ90_02095 [Cyclobacteriaceae bacterium]
MNEEQILKEAKHILNMAPFLTEKFSQHPQLGRIKPENILIEVLKFLNLIYGSNRTLTPSLPVDLAWHEFILCTRLYTKFCNEHFGRYIHHSPGGTQSDNNEQFKKTIQLYILHYGQPDRDAWGDWADEQWSDAQCGSCSS